jgi:signal recognition particle GTPase
LADDPPKQQTMKIGRMIPGASKAMKMSRLKTMPSNTAIIHSMTPIERSKPALIDVKRKARIAKVLEPKLSK